MNEINEKIKDLILEFSQIYKGEDFLELKKYLLKNINPELRKDFSTRDNYSKKHKLNDFEKLIIDNYEQISGVKLKIQNDKLHTNIQIWQTRNNK